MIAEILALVKPWNLGREVELPSNRSDAIAAPGEDATCALVPETLFRKLLTSEKTRAERSERPFVLMQVHLGNVPQENKGFINGISGALSGSLRETDFCGWYRQGSVVGVLCTEIGSKDMKSILSALHTKVSAAFRNKLNPEQANGITLSFQVFPGELKVTQETPAAAESVSPDLQPA